MKLGLGTGLNRGGAPVASPASSFVALGDSFIDRSSGYTAGFAGIYLDVTGWPTVLEQLSGGRFRSVGPTVENPVKTGSTIDRDHGYSGATAYELANGGKAGWAVGFKPVEDAIAAAGDIYIEASGTNDAAAAYTVGQVLANRQALWTAILAAGKKLIVTDILQRSTTYSGWTTTLRDKVVAINAACRAACATQGIPYRRWDDLIAKDENGFALASEFPNDGLHPTQRVSEILAADLHSYLQNRYAGTAWSIPASGSAVWATPNPYLSGTVSGLATSWTAYQCGTAGADYTVEKVTDADGVWQRVTRLTSSTLGFTNVGFYSRLTTGTTPTAASFAGRTVRACARIRVAAGGSLTGVGIAAAKQGPAFFNAVTPGTVSAASAIGASDRVYYSDPFVVPADATQLWIMVSHTRGTGTFDFQTAGLFTID